MGKITSIYLTDEEARKLEKFCSENQCTQYSALKTALRELLSAPMKEEKTSIPEEEGTQSEAKEETEKTEQTEDKTKAQQRKLLEELKKQNS